MMYYLDMDYKQIINTSNLKKLCAIFFNMKFVKKNEYKNTLTIISSYKKSKFSKIDLSTELRLENNSLLSNYFDIDFTIKGVDHIFEIELDINVDNDEIVSYIYKAIQREKINYSDKDFETIILVSLFGLRGSLDLKTNYFSVDLYRETQSKFYSDCVFKLLTNISDIRQLNLNFRELQKEYVENKNNRNTQIRINLRWFYDLIFEEFEKINIYKYKQLYENKEIILSKKIAQTLKNNDGFVNRFIVYRNEILQNKNFEITKMRHNLGFDNLDFSNIRRSGLLKQIVYNLLPDICFSCNDIYNIDTRSFKRKKDDRYYLEIHHIVSLSEDKQGDQIDNLVKLCPTCHVALSKNRAAEEYQKRIIANILKNYSSGQEYVNNLLNNPTYDQIVDFIFQKLA